MVQLSFNFYSHGYAQLALGVDPVEFRNQVVFRQGRRSGSAMDGKRRFMAEIWCTSVSVPCRCAGEWPFLGDMFILELAGFQDC